MVAEVDMVELILEKTVETDAATFGENATYNTAIDAAKAHTPACPGREHPTKP